MAFDLDTYLARIGLSGRPGRDVAGLTAIQRAQRLTIPFENLDIPLGRPIRIDSDGVFAKLVTARRGGYCFEQNRLFRDALTALGFTVRPLLARVWLGASGDTPPPLTPPPLTHALNLVELDGRAWIADAGFGGGYGPPMALVEGSEAASPDGARHRLRRDDAGWLLERDGPTADDRGASGWQAQYGFTTSPVAEADLALSNHWTATAPGTRFTTFRLVSIAQPTGFASMTNRVHRRRDRDGMVETMIADPADYRARLAADFGLALSDAEAAMLWNEA